VGNNPDSHSSVSGIDGASWNKQCPDGVTDTFQRRKQTVEFQTLFESKDSSNVFKQAPLRTNLPYDAKSLRPEPAVIVLASSVPGNTGGLTWNSSCEEVNSLEVPSVEVVDVGYKSGWIVMSFRLEQPPFPKASSSASRLLGAIASIAFGVGQSRVASVRLVPACALLSGLPVRFPALFPSLSVGVGQNFAATCRLVMVFRGPPFIRCFIAMCASGLLLSSLAHGVGHNRGSEVFPEDSLAVGLDFAEGDGAESCPPGGEGEASDP
jgi:hypothetical protein